MTKFKDFFKQEVINIMAQKMLISVQEDINANIKKQTLLNVWEEEAPVFMNLSMSADPVIENKSLMMPFDGGLFAKIADGMT